MLKKAQHIPNISRYQSFGADGCDLFEKNVSVNFDNLRQSTGEQLKGDIVKIPHMMGTICVMLASVLPYFPIKGYLEPFTAKNEKNFK